MQKEDQAVLSTLSECLRSLQLDQSLNQPTLKYDPDATVIITNVNEKLYNSIFLNHPRNIHGLIDELIAIKRNLMKPLTVWITPETNAMDLEEALKERFESPGPFYGMSLELSKANLRTCPEEIMIERVTTETQANVFAKIFSEVFSFPSLQDHTAIWILKQYQMDKPESISYLAKVNGAPAGVCSLIIDKRFKEFRSGGFYNACVLPEFRKSGVGTAMACHRVEVAKKIGLEYLTILLMSDAMARGYCEKLGFMNKKTMTPYFI